MTDRTDIVIPAVEGEDIEATVLALLADEGARVAIGDDLAEIEVEKLTLVIGAPAAGTVTFEVAEGDVCSTGTPIGFISG